jgi:hypothetical protein
MKKAGSRKPKSALEAKSDAQKIAFAPVVFQVAKSLRDLGVLERIHRARDRGVAAEEIAKDLNLNDYGVKVLLEFGESIELVTLAENRYRLTNTGLFILSDPLTRVNMDFIQDVCYRGLYHLQEAIEEETPAGLKVFGDWPTIYEGLASLPANVQKSWFAFDHYYSDMAFPEALPVVFKRRPSRLFDVGGNTGKWAVACVEHDPDVKVTLLDLPGQLVKARQTIEKKGLEDRIDCLDFDILRKDRPFPGGADAIWMSQFLDCFSEDQIVHILTLAGSGMRPDADLYILEPFWNRQRFDAARYSLQATSLYFTCMANGNSKMYHSGEMIQCIERAGLMVEEQFDDIGVCHTLLRCRLANQP